MDQKTLILILGIVSSIGLIGLLGSLVPWRKLALKWVGHRINKASILLQFGEDVDTVEGTYYGDVDVSLLQSVMADMEGAEYAQERKEEIERHIESKAVNYQFWLVYSYEYAGRKRYLFVPNGYKWRYSVLTGKRIIEVNGGELLPQGEGAGIPDELLTEIAEAIREKEMLKEIRGVGVKLDWMKLLIAAAVGGLLVWFLIGGRTNKQIEADNSANTTQTTTAPEPEVKLEADK